MQNDVSMGETCPAIAGNPAFEYFLCRNFRLLNILRIHFFLRNNRRYRDCEGAIQRLITQVVTA